MSFRINSNTASMSAQRYLVKAQREGQKSLRALASGSRVEEPGNDAAGFAISESLRAQAAGLKQAKGNAESAIAFIKKDQFERALNLLQKAYGIMDAIDFTSCRRDMFHLFIMFHNMALCY